MTNQSLRERFKLPEKKTESVSRALRDTTEAGKIKLADPEQASLRYRHYVPFWA
jgi:ATP-dependent DNA helicase RecG